MAAAGQRWGARIGPDRRIWAGVPCPARGRPRRPRIHPGRHAACFCALCDGCRSSTDQSESFPTSISTRLHSANHLQVLLSVPTPVAGGSSPDPPFGPILGSQRWASGGLLEPALRPTTMDTCRYESEITRRCRESTQNHRGRSRHAWNCLELLGIAGGCPELFFLGFINYPGIHDIISTHPATY